MHNLPAITVAICTRNRANLLDELLQNILSKTDLKDMQLIIVDNASNDGTREIAAKYTNDNIRYFLEPRIGLSVARNRAIQECKTAWISFLDDDAFISDNWLFQVQQMITAHDCAAIGGQILLRFECAESKWVDLKMVRSYLGEIGYGESIRALIFPEHPFGSNMTIKVEVLKALRGFSDELGRVDRKLLSSEEVDIFFRIHKLGLTVFYNPNAVVFHRIFKDRTTMRYLSKRAFYQGQSDAIMMSRRAEPLIHILKHCLSPVKYISKIFRENGLLEFLLRLTEMIGFASKRFEMLFLKFGTQHEK